jgi:NADH pyrophosphatase NudC (nudix superfamily)
VDTIYCGWCGQPVADKETDEQHAKCRQRLSFVDPPRFCAHCGRRMVVQVTPAGWVATCSRHGEKTSNDS